MYKNLLLVIIIAIFAGCSAPKPEQTPSWYTNPPKDFKNFYAVAAASNEQKAKNIAINTLRQNINKDIESSLNSQNNKLSHDTKMFQEVMSATAHLCNTFSMRNVKVEKQALFNSQTLILVSIPREELFKKIQPDLDSKIRSLKEKYDDNKESIAIERYVYLKPLISQYAYLASRTAFAQIAVSTYNSNDNFRVLRELADEYYALKSKINFYVLSDLNSRIYSKAIRDALEKEGLSISNKNKDKNTLKLLITSQTDNGQEYTFNVSKNLVKFTTFDADKNKILFKQHTFIGKSRKNHKDAKIQTLGHINTKIKHLGIFNFIGIQSK